MFFIEGNIGAGKSTFLRDLGDRYNVIMEPVDTWTSMKNADGTNLLENFYSDQKRYAYTFQSIAFRTRLQSLMTQQKPGVNLAERSIYSDRNIFAKTCHEDGHMNQIEFDDYTNWFTWLETFFDVRPTGFIYLRSSPAVSHSRIAKRARDGESTIPIEYLEKLHKKHDDWLLNEDNVLILDANQDFEADPKVFSAMVSQVETFLKKHSI
jgi:deoxyadenosine/deoxycytidine kinase